MYLFPNHNNVAHCDASIVRIERLLVCRTLEWEEACMLMVSKSKSIDIDAYHRNHADITPQIEFPSNKEKDDAFLCTRN